MGRKNQKLEEMLTVPVTKEMKQAIVRLAEARERTVADMGRRLLHRGIKYELELDGKREPVASK